MRQITVYDNGPACQPCRLTKRTLAKLQENGAEFEVLVVPLQENPEKADLFRNMGHAQAPVVEVHDGDTLVDRWSGMRPDKLQGLVQ